MDYGNMLSDSFEYTKEALIEKWVKWILLIIPFMTHGYSMQVFKAIKPAPEVNDWVSNFIDGVKLTIVGIIYFIPIIIIAFIFAFGAIIAVIDGIAMGDPTAIMTGIASAALGLLICGILLLIILIILPIAYIRFARTDSFGEAFNISAILASISKIGWVAYLLSLVILIIAAIIVGIIVWIIASILMLIPILGWLLYVILELVLIPPSGIFVARYFTQVYDSIGSA